LRIDKRFVASAIFIVSVFIALLKADLIINQNGNGTAVIAGGGNGSITIAQGTPIAHYADITFYDAMDSSTTGRAPTKGSGTLTISGDTIVPGPPLNSSSTACLYGTTNAGFKRVGVTASGNLNYSAGRAGFYFVWDTATNDSSTAFGWLPSGDTTPRFAFRKSNSGNSWAFKYEDVSVSLALTAGTTYYVEVEWDDSKAHGFCAGLRTDGGTFTTSNSCTTGPPSNTTFGLLGDSILNSGHSLNGRMDEVIISSDSQRDLYAIRNLGAYPN